MGADPYCSCASGYVCTTGTPNYCAQIITRADSLALLLQMLTLGGGQLFVEPCKRRPCWLMPTIQIHGFDMVAPRSAV